LEEEAAVVETAVDAVLALGVRTPDIAQPGTESAGTEVLGDLVAQEIQSS
jgi:3-isopropylmalate dehydrogenase